MSVTAPPRPPRLRPSDPVTHDELEALVEALIEEARKRARRRRRRNGAAALLVVAAGVAAFLGFGGSGGGGAGSAASARLPREEGPGTSARSAPLLGAFPAKMGWTTAFVFDPRNPDTVYASAGTAGGPAPLDTSGHVFKTTDGGAHWRSTATTGAGWTRADTLAADPRTPGTLYAGNVVAVWKTVDGGRSWQAFNKGLFPAKPRMCDRAGATRPPLCRKFPFGTPGTTSWNRGEGWVTALAVDPANSRIVYSGADGVRKSTDGGHTWKTVFLPDHAVYVYVSALAIAPTRPEAVYTIANNYDGHSSIYKSTDAGKTWRATGSPSSVLANPDSGGGTLVVDPQQPTTLYAAIHGVVSTSTDAGHSWQAIMDGLPQGVSSASLAVDPQHPGTVYAGLFTVRKAGARYKVDYSTSGIYMTTNGGGTWSQVVSDVAIDALAVDPARPTTIYAAGSTAGSVSYRILRSTDGGRTWARAPSG